MDRLSTVGPLVVGEMASGWGMSSGKLLDQFVGDYKSLKVPVARPHDTLFLSTPKYSYFEESFDVRVAVVRKYLDVGFIGDQSIVTHRPFQSATVDDLLELIELRSENTRLRRENEDLKAKVFARHSQRTERQHETVVESFGFQLPEALRPVAERLDRSRSMLDLGLDWDGEGSPGYEEATWQRAAELVVKTSTRHYQLTRKTAPDPVITKGDEGSIDVQWRTRTRNILINIPADHNASVPFFAHDAESPSHDIGAELDPSVSNEWLLAWLLA